VENKTAIDRASVESWQEQGIIEYLGVSDDVRDQFADADCAVLPSYREGTPRTLLEAAAMAIPIIATDVPGCREVVDDGTNGYLCAARDGEDLSKKMIQFIKLPRSEKTKMGKASRKLAEQRFDEKKVIDAYLEVVAEIT